MDWNLFEKAIRLSVNFLDSVIDVNSFPNSEIEFVSKASRQIGLGLMGLADYYMARGLEYGSKDALDELDAIGKFMINIAENESVILGKTKGVPEWCKNLPIPRRNITLLTIAPTGTISLLAGCNSGIEPFFSEITQRTDTTGDYTLDVESSSKPHFKCAVSADGNKDKEVTWEEHVKTQATIQKYVDSGVSKTINFPNHTRRETIAKAFFMAWKEGCKGITVYRNGSRELEVLTPKNVKQNLCPVCSEPTMKYDGCTKCTKCEWQLCTIG